MYRVSIFINASLSFVFMLLGIIGVLYSEPPRSTSVFLLLFILFGFGIFLFFDLICYRILKLNKEKLPLTGWIKNYGILIFIFSILALLVILFMTIAAAYAFFEDMGQFPERQRPFYIIFLLLFLLSVMTYIINAVGYFRSVKENKSILSDYINDIGTSL